MHALLVMVLLAQADLRTSDVNRSEVLMLPFVPQVNGGFTRHLGSGLSYYFHPHEKFSIYGAALYQWGTTIAELTERVEPAGGEQLVLRYVGLIGMEATPINVEVSERIRFSPTGSIGTGWGSFRHVLKPPNAAGPATFGEIGSRPVFTASVGGRLKLGPFAVRLDLRDLLYTSAVDAVNGCNIGDLEAMDRALRSGNQASSALTTPACDKGSFTGINPDTGSNRANDVPLALNATKVPSPQLVHNLGIYLGLGVVF
jgi:hypothetical protein